MLEYMPKSQNLQGIISGTETVSDIDYSPCGPPNILNIYCCYHAITLALK